MKYTVMILGLILIGNGAAAADKKKGDVILTNLLQGSQEQDSLVLDDTKNAYVVVGDYVVPIGKSLTIKEGVTVLFDKGSGIVVQGDISVNGITNAPVLFKGKATGIGYWAGLKVEKSNSSDISGAIIVGAKDAVMFSHCKAAIRKSVLYKNDTGIRCDEASPTIEDCAIVQNRGYGIDNSHSNAHIDHCIIDKNGGYGVGGCYYACACIVNSIISNNRKGGINCHLWDCTVSANQCAFINNKKYEVESGTPVSWDFTENYWGDAMTGVLKMKGCNVRLPKIKDKRHGSSNLGMIDVSKFLPQMPEDCGPRECVRFKGAF